MAQDLQSGRFLPFASFDGATNMAIDEAILECHLQGLVPATLRLYGFAPPAVSIGHGQRLEAKTVRFIESKGFTVVRRPTGGRAVLHLNDLTYSFICSSKNESGKSVSAQGSDEPSASSSRSLQVTANGDSLQKHTTGVVAPVSPVPNALVSQSVAEAYRQICRGLIAALAQLDVELELGASKANYRHSKDCFAVTTAADLHYQGKKLVGSAQLRRKNAVLQHGSLILNQPQGLMSELLGGTDLVGPELNGAAVRHANLVELVGQELSMAKLQQAFLKGFEEAFALKFQVAELTTVERQLVGNLREKYEVAPS